jgi:hypothetical protein
MLRDTDGEPKIRLHGGGGKNGMDRRCKTATKLGLAPQDCEDLERIVVRLLEIAARCDDSSTQYKLMELADELVKLVEA